MRARVLAIAVVVASCFHEENVPDTNPLCAALRFDVFVTNDCGDESFGYMPQGQCVNDPE